jgi:hypothetical protein
MQRQAAQRLVSSIYQLDPESVALIPERVEASNIVYMGTTVEVPPADLVVLVYVNQTTMLTKAGVKGETPPLGWEVYVPGVTGITPQDNPAEPKPSPRVAVIEERTPAPIRAGAATWPSVASARPPPPVLETPVVMQPVAAPVPVPVPVAAPPPARGFGWFPFLFGR